MRADIAAADPDPAWGRLAAAPLPATALEVLARTAPAVTPVVVANPAAGTHVAARLAGATAPWPVRAARVWGANADPELLADTVDGDDPRLAVLAWMNPRMPAGRLTAAARGEAADPVRLAVLANPSLPAADVPVALRRYRTGADDRPNASLVLTQLLSRHPAATGPVAATGAAGIHAVAQHPGGLRRLTRRLLRTSAGAGRVAAVAGRLRPAAADPLLAAARHGSVELAQQACAATSRPDVLVAAARRGVATADVFVPARSPDGTRVDPGMTTDPYGRCRLSRSGRRLDVAAHRPAWEVLVGVVGTTAAAVAAAPAHQALAHARLDLLAATLAPLGAAADVWATFAALAGDWEGPLGQLVATAGRLAA